MRDEPTDIRVGEELAVDAIRAFLEKHIELPSETLVAKQFPGGHSNLTYQISAGELDLVLRRPPLGTYVKSGHDMGREYRVLEGLARIGARAPKPVVYCNDESVIGAPFYVMERVQGAIVRGSRPPSGVSYSADQMRALSEAFVDNLASIHATDLDASGLRELGQPDGYVKRQVEGWSRRYKRAQTDQMSDMESVSEWLLHHLPESSTGTLIHNDYKYDNLVVNPSQLSDIRAVLDWEMAAVGDPLLDLGTSLGYWSQADDPEPMRASPFPPTYLPGNFTRRELVARYEEKTGRSVAHVVFYYAYALFKIAVICQQIYKRFAVGQSKDPRFGRLIFAVALLSQTASRAIELDRIDRLHA